MPELIARQENIVSSRTVVATIFSWRAMKFIIIYTKKKCNLYIPIPNAKIILFYVRGKRRIAEIRQRRGCAV